MANLAAPVPELVVAPVEAFAGDTKKARAAFVDARTQLFAERSSETRTLGIVRCGGSHNGQACTYARPLFVPSRTDLAKSPSPVPAEESNRDQQATWPVSALEAVRACCTRDFVLPDMSASLKTLFKWNQKILDGFVTGHEKCHHRGKRGRASSSQASTESDSHSVQSSDVAPSSHSVTSPAGTPKAQKRSRYSRHPSTWHISEEEWERMEKNRALALARQEKLSLEYSRLEQERLRLWGQANLGLTLYDSWWDCDERDLALLSVLCYDVKDPKERSGSVPRKWWTDILQEKRATIKANRVRELERRLGIDLPNLRRFKLPQEWLEDAHWKADPEWLQYRQLMKFNPDHWLATGFTAAEFRETRQLMLRMCYITGALLSS